MFRKPEFFGSATVGERGQIVLPAEMRKRCEIKAGDKLIVVGMPGLGGSSLVNIMLFKAEFLNLMIERMEQQQDAIREILQKEENTKSEKIE